MDYYKLIIIIKTLFNEGIHVMSDNNTNKLVALNYCQ